MGLELLSDDVPDGDSEDDNQEMRRWANRHRSISNRKTTSNWVKARWTRLRRSGKDFRCTLRGDAGRTARLRALVQFMLDTHSEHGYRETYVQCLVQAQAWRAPALPKFEEDLFKTTNERPFYLIPTAESR